MRPSPQLRQTLRNRMRHAGFDVNGRITSFHRQLAEQAKVTPPNEGELVDNWLYYMTAAEAHNLLNCKRLST